MSQADPRQSRRWSGGGTGAGEGAAGEAHPGHSAFFYRSEAFLESKVADFLLEGAEQGEVLVLLAPEDFVERVRERLAGRGFDWDEAVGDGTLRLADASQHLQRLSLPEGMPDPEGFRRGVGEVVEEAIEAARDRGVRVYAGLAELLARDRRIDAACALEDLWNDFASAHPGLSLLCGYPVPSLDRPEDVEVVERLARRHRLVLPDPGHPALAEDRELALEVSLLQQRAQALEAEVRRREALEKSLRKALADRRRSERETRRTERELRVAKEEAERASQAKSRFLTVVSHELRTPLTAIIGYQDLLEMELKGPINEDQRAFLRNIGTATQQALALMEQLLGLSRIEAGEEEVRLDPVSPGALVKQVAALIEPEAREKGLDLRVSCDALPREVRTDAMKLRQILLNLLGNAVKFTREGRVELRARSEGGRLRFEVADTGDGIAPEDQGRIFEHFTRLDTAAARSRRGLGLGLALSRELAALLGGTITVESTAGKGSTFRLELPLEVPALSSVPIP